MFPIKRQRTWKRWRCWKKFDVEKHIDVEIKLDEFDLTRAERKASYAEIKDYVWNKFGLKVPTLYIAQIKKKCGIGLRE